MCSVTTIRRKSRYSRSRNAKGVLISGKESLVSIVSKAAERSKSVRMHILLLSMAVRRSLTILSTAVSVLWLGL